MTYHMFVGTVNLAYFQHLSLTLQIFYIYWPCEVLAFWLTNIHSTGMVMVMWSI